MLFQPSSGFALPEMSEARGVDGHHSVGEVPPASSNPSFRHVSSSMTLLGNMIDVPLPSKPLDHRLTISQGDSDGLCMERRAPSSPTTGKRKRTQTLINELGLDMSNNQPPPKKAAVVYTINKKSTPQELIQIIKNLQEELDQRTISVNAIQRNFERLAAMYKLNLEELERAREQLSEAEAKGYLSESEAKVLAVMRLELDNTLKAQEKLVEREAMAKEEAARRESALAEKIQSLEKEKMHSDAECTRLKEKVDAQEKQLDQKFLDQLKKEKEWKEKMSIVHEERVKEAEKHRGAIEELVRAFTDAMTAVEKDSLSTPEVLEAKKLKQILSLEDETYFAADAQDLSGALPTLPFWVTHFSRMLKFLCTHLEMTKTRWNASHASWVNFSQNIVMDAEERVRLQFSHFLTTAYTPLMKLFPLFSHSCSATIDSHSVEVQQWKHRLTSSIDDMQKRWDSEKSEMEKAHQIEVSRLQQLLQVMEAEKKQAMNDLQHTQAELDSALANLASNRDAMDEWKAKEEEWIHTQHNREMKISEKHKEIRDLQDAAEEKTRQLELAYKNDIESMKSQMEKKLEDVTKQMKTENESLQKHLVSLQNRVKKQRAALYQAFLSVENSRRRTILAEEFTERQLIDSTLAQLLLCHKNDRTQLLCEIMQGESLARSEVVLAEVTDCAAIVMQFSAAAAQERADKTREEELGKLREALDESHQSLMEKCRASFLEERGRDAQELEKKYAHDLEQLAAARIRCADLEVELDKVNQRLEENFNHAQDLRNATLSSIRCLIAAEKASESAYSCLLCFQLFKNPVTCVPCGHTFCNECLIQHPRNTQFLAGSPHAIVTSPCNFFCPECKSYSASHRVEAKSLLYLSSKFEYKKNVLRDIAKSLEIASAKGNLPS